MSDILLHQWPLIVPSYAIKCFREPTMRCKFFDVVIAQYTFYVIGWHVYPPCIVDRVRAFIYMFGTTIWVPLRCCISKSCACRRNDQREIRPLVSLKCFNHCNDAWSVTTVNLTPFMYCRNFSIADITARHSHSVTWYFRCVDESFLDIYRDHLFFSVLVLR